MLVGSLQAALPALHALPNFEGLEVAAACLSSARLGQLAEAISSLPHLRRLKLRLRSGVGADDGSGLLAAAMQLHRLEELHLELIIPLISSRGSGSCSVKHPNAEGLIAPPGAPTVWPRLKV